MLMFKLGRFYYVTGFLLMALGLVSGYSGYHRMLSYFRYVQSADGVTVGLFAFGLIVPHIMVFAGIGGTVLGLIWIVHGILLGRRNSRDI